MGGDGVGGGGRRVKALLGALVVVISMWLLFIGILASVENKGVAAETIASSGKLRHLTLAGKESHSVPGNPNLIFSSKRRVPSGPDPIHNRHVGETRQPPGRV